MVSNFDKYWETIHKIIELTTILDWRYKLKFLEYFFSHFYKDLADYEIQKICYSLTLTWYLHL